MKLVTPHLGIKKIKTNNVAFVSKNSKKVRRLKDYLLVVINFILSVLKCGTRQDFQMKEQLDLILNNLNDIKTVQNVEEDLAQLVALPVKRDSMMSKSLC